MTAREFARRNAPETFVGGATQFRAAWERFARSGLYRIMIPEGSLDADVVLDTLEGLGEGTGNAGFLLAMGAHSFAVAPSISRFGDEAQRRLLGPLRDGSIIASFAASEPDAGSDVMSLRTRCTAIGSDYVLEGTKHFVTNAGCADLFLVFATTNPRLNWRGLTAFLVPHDAHGLSLGSEQRLIGLTGCSIRAIHLESTTVPRSAILGRLGGGSSVFRHAMMWERSLLSVLTLGSIRRKLTSAIEVASSHERLSANTTGHQDVAGLVVNILARYLVGRLLVRDTVAKLAAGTLKATEASLTKLWMSEAGVATSRDLAALDVGNGLVTSSACVEDDFLNAVGATIYSGTSDIQKTIIAAELGILQ